MGAPSPDVGLYIQQLDSHPETGTASSRGEVKLNGGPFSRENAPEKLPLTQEALGGDIELLRLGSVSYMWDGKEGVFKLPEKFDRPERMTKESFELAVQAVRKNRGIVSFRRQIGHLSRGLAASEDVSVIRKSLEPRLKNEAFVSSYPEQIGAVLAEVCRRSGDANLVQDAEVLAQRAYELINEDRVGLTTQQVDSEKLYALASDGPSEYAVFALNEKNPRFSRIYSNKKQEWSGN